MSENERPVLENASADPMPPSIQEIYNQQVEQAERERREGSHRDIARYQESLKRDPQSPEAYIEIARCYFKLGRYKDALAFLEHAYAAVPPANSYPLFRWHIGFLAECNRTRDAIALAKLAAVHFPDDILLKLREALVLPVIYESPAEMEEYRARVTQAISKICGQVSLGSSDEKKNALRAVAGHVNLYLGYQARNDRELQVEYGNFVHRVMAANFPDWMKPVPMPDIPPDGKTRIGYISSRFRNLSATKYFFGWIRERQKDAFTIYAYHTGPKIDSITEQVRQASDHFRHIPNSLKETCEAVLADRLHVLVFLDVGLEPLMTQLAALRLAPVQCAAWDQPITTGLSTVDYFISSALTEPEGAQEHYSEDLICLPGVGVSYQKPVIPAVLLTKTRRDFQLREDAVIYLCIQYAYKYLPDQDHLLAQIAAQVPNSQFVFLSENELVAEDLRRRLERAFSAAKLKAADYCVVLPALERFAYWNLSLVGDVFLDSIGWSGGVSTFEAVACRLPIVTLPGEFMRGRQTYAILTQLGVTETIARNEEEFVRIAVRLGQDKKWRAEIAEQMAANYSSLFSNTKCVRALEEFFQRTVTERLRTQQSSPVSGGGK